MQRSARKSATTSPPPTPSSMMCATEVPRFLDYSNPCEDPEMYRPSGFHSVHLGDTFKYGRYRASRFPMLGWRNGLVRINILRLNRENLHPLPEEYGEGDDFEDDNLKRGRSKQDDS
ncbi:hypothetical protein G7Y89_g10204 [Cudoniella acicularis]|uniref:Uncharacterized protein n=1 Tax=Cudoniella acicularis TaxID=354080 RepID=A0A8H4RD81_9HELO|nr:hypothetical protein G7Y89_g10204 [Cudoniella acicularis]